MTDERHDYELITTDEVRRRHNDFRLQHFNALMDSYREEMREAFTDNIFTIPLARNENVTDTATPSLVHIDEVDDDPIMRAVMCDHCGLATGEFAERQPRGAYCQSCANLPGLRHYRPGDQQQRENDNEYADVEHAHCRSCGSTNLMLRVYGTLYIHVDTAATDEPYEVGDTVEFSGRARDADFDDCELVCSDCESYCGQYVAYEWNVS